MATLLTIKDYVANQLGKDDGSTPNSKRDKIINQARRKFYSEKRWSFLRTQGNAPTFTNYVANLPANYNIKYDPIAVYAYSGNAKFQYSKVSWDDLDEYGTADYVYAIDKINRTIKVSQNPYTVYLDYTYLPADKDMGTSDDTDAEPIDDITPIGLLAVAMWWLASERATGKHQMFLDEYNEELSRLKEADASSHAIRFFKPPVRLNTGYNRGR